MTDYSKFVGKVCELTWRTGHVSQSKVISDEGECLLTAEHLFKGLYCRPSKKNKGHIVHIKVVTLH